MAVLGDRYRLIDRLGVGGMSVVWRGLDEVLGRPVAIKVLSARCAAAPGARQRIRAEARAAAQLSHPHICHVHDYGEARTDDGEHLPYLVMELLSGQTLADALRAGPMPAPAVLRMGAQVASALAAAHSQGVVHRDIKPGNIMMTPVGPKVVDFGVAAAAGEPGDSTSDGEVWGTPGYVAPERLTGGDVVPASDIYGLGLLLYRALTGELPWESGTASQLLRAHQYVAPAPLPPIDGLPSPVARLIHRCLAKPAARRPTADEVARRLAEAGGWRLLHTAGQLLVDLDAPPRRPDRVPTLGRRLRSVLAMPAGVAKRRRRSGGEAGTVRLEPAAIVHLESATVHLESAAINRPESAANRRESGGATRLEPAGTVPGRAKRVVLRPAAVPRPATGPRPARAVRRPAPVSRHWSMAVVAAILAVALVTTFTGVSGLLDPAGRAQGFDLAAPAPEAGLAPPAAPAAPGPGAPDDQAEPADPATPDPAGGGGGARMESAGAGDADPGGSGGGNAGDGSTGTGTEPNAGSGTGTGSDTGTGSGSGPGAGTGTGETSPTGGGTAESGTGSGNTESSPDPPPPPTTEPAPVEAVLGTEFGSLVIRCTGAVPSLVSADLLVGFVLGEVSLSGSELRIGLTGLLPVSIVVRCEDGEPILAGIAVG